MGTSNPSSCHKEAPHLNFVAISDGMWWSCYLPSRLLSWFILTACSLISIIIIIILITEGATEVQRSWWPHHPSHWHVLIWLKLTEVHGPQHNPSWTPQLQSLSHFVHVSNWTKSLEWMSHLFTRCSSISLCLRLIKQWCPTSLRGSGMCLWGSTAGLEPGSVQERRARSHGKWAPKQLWEEPGITGQEQPPARPLQTPGCHCSKSISQTNHSICIPTTSLCSWSSSYLPLPLSSFHSQVLNGVVVFVFSPGTASPSWSPSHQTGIWPLFVPMARVLGGTELCFTVSVCFQCLCSQIRSNLCSAGSRAPASMRFYVVHHRLPRWALPHKSNPLNQKLSVPCGLCSVPV